MNISDFDPISLNYTARPQEFIVMAIDKAPVMYSEQFDAWFVFNYDCVKAAAVEGDFTKSHKSWEQLEAREDNDRWPIINTTHRESPFLDPEKHRQTRALFANSFKPRVIANMENIVKAVVEERCARMKLGGVIDVVKMLESIPNTVIAQIVGVAADSKEEGLFVKSASDFLRSVSPFATDEDKDIAELGGHYLSEILKELIEVRRETPKDDLLSQLVITANEMGTVTEEDIIISMISIIAAGTDTTRHGTAMAIRTLLNNPVHFEALQSNRQLLDNAILELLRYDFPSKFIPRFATRNCTLGNESIPKGKAVFISIHGAGWDSRIFDNPHEIRFDRDHKQYLVFGHGVHYCLGAHLAKLQMKHVLGFCLDTISLGAQIKEEEIKWDYRDLIMRGMTTMPLVL